MTNDYDMAKAQADAAFVSDVARWLEGQHDYAEQKDQPWFARAAEMLRSLERLTEGEEIERRARGSFERTRNAVGWREPDWRELSEQTRCNYRIAAIKRLDAYE